MGDSAIFGQFCAIMTALTWAVALVFFKLSGERVPPLALNLFKNTVAVVLLVITLYVIWIFDRGAGLAVLQEHSLRDIAILLLSGFIGIAVADTLFFHGLNLIGVGISAIVDCLYSPSVIFFSVIMLGESLGPWQIVGAAAVLAAVLSSSKLRPPQNRTHGQLVIGIMLGATAMAMMGYGIVLAKPVIEQMPLIWATTLRLLAGSVSLAFIAALSPRRKIHFSAFKPSNVWKWSIPGAILGAYVSMIFWIAGFKYMDASIAGILNQTSSIFAIILATLVLKEPFTRRKLLAIALAMTGVAMVTLNQVEKPADKPPPAIVKEEAVLTINRPRTRLSYDTPLSGTIAGRPHATADQNSDESTSSMLIESYASSSDFE